MIDEFIGKTVAEKYRIESLLRDSDLGAIYHALHIAMDKPVTVKILSPAVAIDARYVENFLSEAKTAAGVSHPNLLNVIDFGTDSRNTTYIVYDAGTGESLKELMKRDGALPFGQALSIAKQTAFALAAAHTKGLTHGGLNPDKILFSKDEQAESVKVFDLGTQPIKRTPKTDLAYLAPEQYTDTTANDERSDIYSVGAILFEMLSGELPFKGETTAELKGKHENEPPAPLISFRDDLPADLEPMILTALASDPERRYQKMESFAEDLQMLSGGAPIEPKAAAAAGGKRNIWQTAFIVLAGIAILASALIFFTTGRKTDPTTVTQLDPDSLPVQPIGPATGAQEESLAKLPDMTEAEIMAAQMGTAGATDMLPGGDGYNAWANNGAPPIGAPQPGSGAIPPTGMPQQYQPPGGQTVVIDPNGGSQFMPQEGGIILVPVPKDSSPAPTPTPQAPAGNTAVQPAATPKPMATPVPKTTKPATPPGKTKQAAGPKPIGKPADTEL